MEARLIPRQTSADRRVVAAQPIAEATAAQCRHPQTDTRHLLFGLAMSDGMAAELLRQAGVSVEALPEAAGELPVQLQAPRRTSRVAERIRDLIQIGD